MTVLGFQPGAIKWFEHYLKDRQQVVYIDGATSEALHIGNKSVIQGTVMSCILYLIYILDIPTLHHETKHNTQEADDCNKPVSQTFVDDLMVTIQEEADIPLQQTIVKTIDTIEDYMQANKLALNRDKTQLLVINKDPSPKTYISIQAEPTNITPKSTLKFLGVKLSEKLDWTSFLLEGKDSLYNQLNMRISAIKKLRAHVSFKFARNLANALFIGKLNYAAEVWGGAPDYIVKKFQHLQLVAARTVIGPHAQRWSTKKLLTEMDWMSVRQILAFTSNKMTYKMIHHKQPELLYTRMKRVCPPAPHNTRLSGPNKLGPRPPKLGRSKWTKNQYRAKSHHFYAQLPDAIQNLANYKHFSKWMVKFYKYNAVTPNEKLPTFLSVTDDGTSQFPGLDREHAPEEDDVGVDCEEEEDVHENLEELNDDGVDYPYRGNLPLTAGVTTVCHQ